MTLSEGSIDLNHATFKLNQRKKQELRTKRETLPLRVFGMLQIVPNCRKTPVCAGFRNITNSHLELQTLNKIYPHTAGCIPNERLS